MMDCPFLTTIFLGNGRSTQVDPASWLLYALYNWQAHRGRGGWYAATRIKVNGRARWFYLHRLIARCPQGMITHHDDGDTLNNHQENLVNMTWAEHKDLHKFRIIARRNHGNDKNRR